MKRKVGRQEGRKGGREREGKGGQEWMEGEQFVVRVNTMQTPAVVMT